MPCACTYKGLAYYSARKSREKTQVSKFGYYVDIINKNVTKNAILLLYQTR